MRAVDRTTILTYIFLQESNLAFDSVSTSVMATEKFLVEVRDTRYEEVVRNALDLLGNPDKEPSENQIQNFKEKVNLHYIMLCFLWRTSELFKPFNIANLLWSVVKVAYCV